MFQKLAVDEDYYQRHLEAEIREGIKAKYPRLNCSVIGFICAGKNYFCVQAMCQSELVRLKPNIETTPGDSTPQSQTAELPLIEVGVLEFDKKVFNSDLEEMIDFCPDSISGCSNCTKLHFFEPQDIPALEQQIRENLVKILKSGNIQSKKDSFDELAELAENYVLVKLPPLEYLGHHALKNSKSDYYNYVKFLVKTALVCMRILDYIKYGIKVVANRPYEEELAEYKKKIKEILHLKNPKNIYELNLSKRVIFLLLRANIFTVQELKELTEEAILGIKGIGEKSMKEIFEMRELLLP